MLSLDHLDLLSGLLSSSLGRRSSRVSPRLHVTLGLGGSAMTHEVRREDADRLICLCDYMCWPSTVFHNTPLHSYLSPLSPSYPSTTPTHPPPLSPPTAVRFNSGGAHAHETESYESFNQRYQTFFSNVEDVFELQRGLNNCFAYDLVPSTDVIEAALKAARKVDDYATAVRILEGVKEKVENKGQYQAYLDELKPVISELGEFFSRGQEGRDLGCARRGLWVCVYGCG